ncbi:hypothetical protein Q4493_15755 [Colwellia sp. 1_MG-2023]|uniref:hypothetical protein n=1 Tax=Colwellia sp. 1_MG-2023 TaxID=3062649 RepID=UPI0026E27510|nr:hypothetical protein [Colwellia sp. 1_MG-2023]MDO6447224.1 hypothetical protein [Colwellia sp. 1_MG-2023]
MSIISNVILTTAIYEGAWSKSDYGNVDLLNDYLRKNYQGTCLRIVHDKAGGHQQMTCDIFMAAVDYLDVDALVNEFLAIEWQKPEQAQLMIRSNLDEKFQLFSPN